MTKNQSPRILIVRTDRIGEVLLSTALVDAVKKHIPDAHVSFATSPVAHDLMLCKPGLDHIETFDTGDNVSLLDTIKFAGRLRKHKYDVAIVLNSHKYSHLAVFLAGIKIRIGFNRKWPGFLTHRFIDNRGQEKMHEIEYSLELLQPLDIRETFIHPSLTVPEAAKQSVKELFAKHNIDASKKNVIIHPGSNFEYKRWPMEYYTQLIDRMYYRDDVNFLLIGTKEEKELCDKIAVKFGGRVYSLAGESTLLELAALIDSAQLVIANDSGPMHIAFCLDKPLVAIFGRGTKGAGPKRWGPRGERSFIFHKHLGCTHCYNELCPYNFKCLKAVMPDEIFSAVIQNQLLEI
jgi:lipopolysaccharide heptosyltransferase II